MKKFNITFRFFWKDVIHKFSNIEYSVGRGGGKLDKKKEFVLLERRGVFIFHLSFNAFPFRINFV